MASKKQSLSDVVDELRSLSLKLDIVQSYIQSKFGIDFTLYMRQKEKEHSVQLLSRPAARTRSSGRNEGGRGTTYNEMAMEFVEDNVDVSESDVFSHLAIKQERGFDLGHEVIDEEESEGPCIFPGEEEDDDDPLDIVGSGRNDCDYVVDSDDSGGSRDSLDGRKRRRKWAQGPNISQPQPQDRSRRYPPNRGSSEDLSLLPNGKRLCLTEIETETEGLLVWPSSTQTSYSVGYNGFLYLYHATGQDKQGLRCAQSNDPKRKCKGRLHVSLDYKRVLNAELGGPDRHNHPPRIGKAEALRALWRIKMRLINENVDDKGRKSMLKAIVDEETAHLDENGRRHLPTWESLKRNLQRAKKRMKDRTEEAKTSQNLSQENLLVQLPPETSESLDGPGRSGSSPPLSLLGHMVGSAEEYARSFQHL